MATPASAAPSPDDRTMAVLIHVLGIFTGFLGPLIIWLVKKDQSPFVDRHGRAALNWQITLVIAYVVSFVLILILIGIFLMMALGVVAIIFGVLAAIAANKGEDYRYPMAITFLKNP